MARENVMLKPLLDRSGHPVNLDDAEAYADALMADAGVKFGKSSGIFTEKQFEALNQRRKDISLDDLYEYDLTDFHFQSSQQIMDIARDELQAGIVVGIDDSQQQILSMLLDGWTYREISSDLNISLGFISYQMADIRARIKRKGSSLWIWLTIAEVFGMSVSAVRDELT